MINITIEALKIQRLYVKASLTLTFRLSLFCWTFLQNLLKLCVRAVACLFSEGSNHLGKKKELRN